MSNNNIQKEIFVNETVQDFEILGYIAQGGESVVYEGEKLSIGRTYALKFRPRSLAGGDMLDEFYEYELPIYCKLKDCTTNKIAGIIDHVANVTVEDLNKLIPVNKASMDTGNDYFCIIEDFIVGCNLYEYCKGDPIKNLTPHTPAKDASFEEILEFQEKIINWIIQFCDIMQSVTRKNQVLHLDIKPENIMVSRDTGSLVLIDFGKSFILSGNEKGIYLGNVLGDADIDVTYGTRFFAAPECIYTADPSKSLFSSPEFKMGMADERSDIFSFGATIWDCINPQAGIRIKENKEGYFRRDLFSASPYYSEYLEDIIIKCTEEDPSRRFSSFAQLKETATKVKKNLPLPGKPSRLSKASKNAAILFACIWALFFVLSLRGNAIDFRIAKHNFDEMAASYTEHNLYAYKDTAIKLIQAEPKNKTSYYEVLELSYNDKSGVSKSELMDVLFNCLSYNTDPDITVHYINKVMANTTENNAKTISESIALKESFSDIRGSDGLNIARAIYNYMSNPSQSYSTLIEYRDNEDYRVSIKYLAKVLLNETNVLRQIANEQATGKEEVESVLIAIMEG